MDFLLRSAPLLPRRRPAARFPALSLAPRATLRLRLAAGTRVGVDSGRIWLTETGCADDHFIAAGQEHVIGRTCRVVIEGDAGASSSVRITRA